MKKSATIKHFNEHGLEVYSETVEHEDYEALMSLIRRVLVQDIVENIEIGEYIKITDSTFV